MYKNYSEICLLINPNKSFWFSYILMKGGIMADLRSLFEYQKFSQNESLKKKIDEVTRKYMSGGTELSDYELDVAAAGDVYQERPFMEDEDA